MRNDAVRTRCIWRKLWKHTLVYGNDNMHIIHFGFGSDQQHTTVTRENCSANTADNSVSVCVCFFSFYCCRIFVTRTLTKIQCSSYNIQASIQEREQYVAHNSHVTLFKTKNCKMSHLITSGDLVGLLENVYEDICISCSSNRLFCSHCIYLSISRSLFLFISLYLCTFFLSTYFMSVYV